jgi:hypothetical protein
MLPSLSKRPMVPKRVSWLLPLTLVLVLLVLSGCRDEPSSSVFFPKYELVNGELVQLTALIDGKIVEVDGCLRLIASSDDTSYLIVWPPDFGLDIDGSDIRIRVGISQIIARVGQEVHMGGGGGRSIVGAAGVSDKLITS